MSKKETAVPAAPKFFLTKKEYNPKVMHTQKAWEIVQKTVGVNGATRDELVAALTYSDKAWKETSSQEGWIWKKQNHQCFIGYMVKLGALQLKG